MENYDVKILKLNSPEYKKALVLRDEILRIPLGMSIYNDDLSDENLQIHIGCVIEGEVVGILLLRRVDNETVQMRQVAVVEFLQGKGLGNEMVVFAEKIAKSNSYSKIILHARKTAVSFYEKLLYTKTSDEYLEIGIPHCTMEKNI